MLLDLAKRKNRNPRFIRHAMVGGVVGLLLLLAGRAHLAQAQAETTKTQARRIDGVLQQLYPDQDITVKLAQPGPAPAPKASAQTAEKTTTTARLVVRRPKLTHRAANKNTTATQATIVPAVTLDDLSSVPLAAAPAYEARSSVTMTRTEKQPPDLAAIIGAPLAHETSPTLTVTTTVASIPSENATAPAKPKPTPAAVSTPVRVNGASADELRDKLKLDARRARNIVEFRDTYGPFQRPEDLAQVNGINDDMVRHWEDQRLLIID